MSNQLERMTVALVQTKKKKRIKRRSIRSEDTHGSSDDIEVQIKPKVSEEDGSTDDSTEEISKSETEMSELPEAPKPKLNGKPT